jgi:hypothetical protein
MNSESRCKLCGNPADKTGSHLPSSSFISNYINREGTKGRDNELMYTIEDSFHKKDLFLGRKTAGRTDEELANIVGKSIEKIEEIRSEKNSIVVDYLFCTKCEKDFGKLESLFANKCHKDFLNGDIKSSDISTVISFFLLNIWRCSVANRKQESFNLKTVLEKAVGNYFLQLFKKHDGLTESNLSMFPKNVFVELFVYPVEKVLEPQDESKFFLFLHPKLKQPYFIMLGRFIVLLHEKKNHLKNSI